MVLSLSNEVSLVLALPVIFCSLFVFFRIYTVYLKPFYFPFYYRSYQVPAGMRTFTSAELANFKVDPVYLSIKGRVFDVSSNQMYKPGPDGEPNYSCFAGKDCSRAFAMMSLSPECMTCNLRGLKSHQFQNLNDWEKKIEAKYKQVGVLVEADVHAYTPEYL